MLPRHRQGRTLPGDAVRRRRSKSARNGLFYIQDYVTPMLDRTDSYCERCGSHYAFGANAPRTLSLKGARVLAKGLKNFVLTDGQSMADAMSLARHEDEHDDTTRMTEAFHRTFNFCMTCRQYACLNCWNPRQGACLTCAPEEEVEPVAPRDHLIVRTPVAPHDSDWELFPQIASTVREPAVDAAAAPAAWPAADLEVVAPNPAESDVIPGPTPSMHAPADQEAWTRWPIADEIAPEMTLTPEELQLVEARLATDQPAASPVTVDAQPPAPAPPEVPDAAAWTPPIDLADVEAEAGRPYQPVPEDRPMETAGDVAARVADQPAAPAATPQPSAPLAVEPRPVPAPREYPAYERPPAGARLLGAMAPPADRETPTSHPIRSPGRSAAGELWPQVTLWSERPIRPYDWSAASSPAVDEPPAVQAEVPNAAVPAEPPPTDTGPAQPALTEPHAGEGAFHEVAAAPLVIEEPAGPTSTFEPAPVRDSQQTLFEPTSTAPDAAPRPMDRTALRPPTAGDAAAARPSVEPFDAVSGLPPHAVEVPPPSPVQEPAPWPPLGASWPAQEAPGVAWPTPETPPIPAALAAKETAPPVFAEMWAQSAQEVLSRGTVRVCHRCALPVSTQARFCRRCGTKQA
jgi:ribosomal protein L40E